MNKSKSYPIIIEEETTTLRKSNSLDNLDINDFYFEEFFEGDGELGIVFGINKEKQIIIQNILPNTVASETYGIYKSMILLNINNNDIEDLSLSKLKMKINKEWIKNSRIYLKFQKPIHKEVYTTLLNNNLSKYYDQFVELGASSFSDFEFVEYEDLIKMNMNKSDITSFKNINPNI